MNAPTLILMDVDQHAGLPFPRSLPEFQRLFPGDAACAEYLEKVHWGDGFVCPHCGVTGEPFRISTRPGVRASRNCRRQTGLTVGTVMERSHTPLSTWFWAAYLVASQTQGMSAVQFQRQLGLTRYETAFQILHKLRAGMVRPHQDRIGGRANEHVEVDETWIGGRTRGEGRGVHHKVLVACAVEVRHRKPGTARDKRNDGRYAGRVRLAVAADRSAKSLCGFVDGAVAPGTLIVTDDWSGYADLRKRGYDHHAIAECGDSEVTDEFLPIIHLVFANLKTWLIGILTGSANGIYKPTSTNSRFGSTGASTRSTPSVRCSASLATQRRRPMPSFIPATGITLHLEGECVNRIGVGRTIIVEVKTTGAYRISLDVLVGYREKLSSEKHIGAASSILISVGREDTGELEAQVRGSRHAWDIRIISAEALLKLARLKENAADPETGKKIRSLLVPMEYTRLDPMIEVMFSTAQDIEPSLVGEVPTQDGQEEIEESAASTGQKGTWEFTDSVLLQKKREDIVAAVSKENSVPLIKKSRALFWSPDHHIRLVCTVSKRYTKPGAYKYWYAYHPEWNEFLNEGKFGYFVLGCMDLKIAFAIPHGEL